MVQLLFDYLPIVLFFITFKLYDIYTATGVAIAASFLQVGIYYYSHRKFEKMHVIMFVLITILGGATLLLHQEIFIKWKPTAVYWVLALIFLSSHFIGKKTAIKLLLENNLDLPESVWKRLNLGWMTFFILLGIANLLVVYHFDTNTWVNFKLFGTLGLTALFIILQSFYLTKYCTTPSDDAANPIKDESPSE